MEKLNEYGSKVNKEEAKQFAEKRWGTFYDYGIDDFYLGVNPVNNPSYMLLIPFAEYSFLNEKGYWDKGISRIKEIPKPVPDRDETLELIRVKIDKIRQAITEIEIYIDSCERV
jgi:hypothetical protein